MQTAVTHGIPQHPTDLPRGYVPFAAFEADVWCKRTGRLRRQRVVRVITPDQNHLKDLVEDLGPPSGEDGVYVPCEGGVDMVYLHELLDQALRNRAERNRAKVLRLPERHEAIRLGLINYAEQAILAKAARSTFGPYQRTERSG